MKRCFFCFRELDENVQICPYCGQKAITDAFEVIELKPGMLLQGRYLIGASVGSGGFGIIYRAWDTKLDVLVAIKEFYPKRLVTRAGGMSEVIVSGKMEDEFIYRKERFLAEARNMAKLGSHKNIPNVFEFFEANNTAYIVMEYLDGISLSEYLKQNGGILDMEFALFVLGEVGNALSALHENGIVHRDVAPDNVFICTDQDIRIKLLDLGAAKLADNTDDTIDIILKPGYSPPEQYDVNGKISPWTDIYALGATFYMMLTGVKPEESTNRKVSDDLKTPSEILPSIPEDLSNTIMRAMAVEANLRFRSVSEFLQAAAGEKKVVPIDREKRNRKMKKMLGISAACAGVVVLAVLVFGFYTQKRAEQYLNPATLTVWYCSESAEEDAAMEAVVSDFSETFENVDVQLTAFSPDEYNAALSQAAESDALPSVFESAGADETILQKAEDISNVLNSEQAEDCYFLDQYDLYYREKKKVPLGIEVPMAYIITGGPEQTDYEEHSFSAVADFENAVVAADSRYAPLLRSNFDVSGYPDETTFLNNEKNTSSVLLSSSMILNEVKQTLTNYEKNYACLADDKVKCRFIYEWSIGDGSANEIYAAERLLSWMLGDSYQNILMIGRCSDGQIPVNKTCFESKTGSAELSGVGENYGKFVFASE